MAQIHHESIVDVDLDNGTLFRSFNNNIIGEGDENGNRFGVRIFRNGTPVNVSDCTAMGYFIRADGVTEIISGIISGNEAYITLTETCYAVEGNFSLVIKLTGGSVTGTMRIVDGTVVNTITDAFIDPGHIIPDIDEYLAAIEQAEEAAETVAGFVVTEQLISGTDYRLIVDVAEGD